MKKLLLHSNTNSTAKVRTFMYMNKFSRFILYYICNIRGSLVIQKL